MVTIWPNNQDFRRHAGSDFSPSLAVLWKNFKISWPREP
jgi:hypothetical protein